MSRPNYIAFVRLLYKFQPGFLDWQILAMLDTAYARCLHKGKKNNATLRVWKAKLRKEGLNIPDRRKTKGEPNARN